MAEALQLFQYSLLWIQYTPKSRNNEPCSFHSPFVIARTSLLRGKKKIASMLSLDCVGEILAPLKSTEMLTFISPWTGDWKQVQCSTSTQWKQFKDGWTAFDWGNKPKCTASQKHISWAKKAMLSPQKSVICNLEYATCLSSL